MFTSFAGLERFENAGLITMQNNRAGDRFQISNTVGGTNLTFSGGRGSTLAVDTFLGTARTSKSDIFNVQGNVTGKTLVQVANTNTGAAQFDPNGIPVIVVDGKVAGNEFYLDKPVDTGFFDYDLFSARRAAASSS